MDFGIYIRLRGREKKTLFLFERIAQTVNLVPSKKQ